MARPKKRRQMIFAMAATAVIASPAAATDRFAAAAESLIGALDTCTPVTVETPHLLVRDYDVVHIVDGMSEGGLCLYTQTMPGDMLMDCALTVDGRQAFIDEWVDLLETASGNGSLTISTSDPSPAWAGECEIVLPNGQVVAANGSTRIQ